MITVSRISGPVTAREFARIEELTGEPLMLIKQRMDSGDVFLSCPYPNRNDRLEEFVRLAHDLDGAGISLSIHEVMQSGDRRPITLEILQNFVELRHGIAKDREAYDALVLGDEDTPDPA